MDSDIIKSAREIALEKIEKLGQATEEERLGWKYLPLGEALAARYLKDDSNLLADLSQYQENVKKYVIRGASQVLVRNISLPKNEVDKKKNKKTMDGLKLIKTDKVGVENIYSKLRYLFTHYDEQGEQQRRQAYQSLKVEIEGRIQEAVQKQLGSATAAGKIDVEKQPQFQQEWRKLQAQLDSAYLVHLNDYKQELSAIG
jgi:hypothetical protein